MSGRRFAPGIAAATAIGATALIVGHFVPILGGPVVAIVLGLVVRQVIGDRPALTAGVKFCAKQVLQAAIVLFGAGMSLGQIADVGGAGLPVMLGTLAAALLGGFLLTRALRVEREVGSLVTYGTAICGASAIATMSAVMGASGSAVAYAITVIVVFNVLGALLFPPVGHALGLSDQAFALWAGTAVNDTSSVVAAASVYSAGVVGYAVVVKLTRTLAIIPLAMGVSWRRQRAEAGGGKVAWWRLVPAFLVFFLLAAALNSAGVIPDAWAPGIKQAAVIGTTVAMAGVGLTSSLSDLRRAGLRPVVLGGVLWVIVAASSLALQWLTGQL